jgi:4-amino-4-deoxy-L-arabinose transferase-like glycosyltransferase
MERKQAYHGRKQDFLNIILLVVLACGLFMFRLGERGLADPEEGRNAEIAREMVELDDWTTPRLNYIKRFHKPPLVFWDTALSIKVFGLGKVDERIPSSLVQPFRLIFTGHNEFIDEFTVRFPGAVATILTIVGAYMLGRMIFNHAVGLMAGLALMTSPEFFTLGHILNMDMHLTCFVTFAYLFFFLAVDEKSSHGRLWSSLLFFSLGLGALTKGFIILLVALLPIVLWDALFFRGAYLKRVKYFPSVLVFLAVALPWYIIVCVQNKGLLEYFLFDQSLSRAYDTTFRKAAPMWYFIPVLMAGFFPWVAFLPYSFIKHLKFKTAMMARHQRWLLLLFFWFVAPFAAFSLFPSKLPTYILPLYPALAIIVAFGFYRLLRDETSFCKRFSGSFKCFGLVTVTGLVGIGVVYLGLKFVPKLDIFRYYILAIAVLIIAGSMISMFAYIYRKKYFLFVTIFSTVFLLFIEFIFISAEIDRHLGIKVTGRNMSRMIIDAGGEDDTVIMCGRFLSSVPFYLRKRIVTVRTGVYAPFDDEEELKRFIYRDLEGLRGFLKSDRRLFCIIKESMMAELDKDSYRVVDQVSEKKLFLITNKHQ